MKIQMIVMCSEFYFTVGIDIIISSLTLLNLSLEVIRNYVDRIIFFMHLNIIIILVIESMK